EAPLLVLRDEPRCREESKQTVQRRGIRLDRLRDRLRILRPVRQNVRDAQRGEHVDGLRRDVTRREAQYLNLGIQVRAVTRRVQTDGRRHEKRSRRVTMARARAAESRVGLCGAAIVLISSASFARGARWPRWY